MTVSITFNGTAYTYPQAGDVNWGDQATLCMQAAATSCLQKTGGAFTLSAETDFGSSFGLKTLYYRSRAASAASAGQIRLGPSDVVSWLDAASAVNLDLKPVTTGTGTELLQYNGQTIVGISSTQTITNKNIGSSTANISLTGGTLSGVNIINGTAVLNITGGTASGQNVTGGIFSGINVTGATASGISMTGGTLTNVTINAGLNTVSEISNGHISTTAAIARSKSASGSVDHVIINDGSGLFSSEATLAKSRGGFGADASSLNIPMSGTLVEAASAQAFTNKTFSDAITLAAIATPATPASNFGKTYFKTDGYLYQMDSTGAERKVGAGNGGINYCTNPDAESSTTGWVIYNENTASATPVSGVGGTTSTAILSLSAASTNTLRGTKSFSLIKAASNSISWGVGYNFTIDNADQAKVICVSFDYRFAATGYTGTTAASLKPWVYDVTNAQMIQPSLYYIDGPSANTATFYKYQATFQTASNSTSYRLIMHSALTDTTAWTMNFDNVSISPQVLTYGAPITDWTAFIPTGGWTTNCTYTGLWRRVGADMECRIKILASSAIGPTGTNLTINIPNGYNIDTTKLLDTTSTVYPLVGVANAFNTPTTIYSAVVNYNNVTSVIVIGNLTGTSGIINTIPFQSSYPFVSHNGDIYEAAFQVPILGWGSSVQMSSDTDTRVVAAKAASSTVSCTGGANTTITYTGVVFDTHNALNATAGTYTVPIAGYYRTICNFTASYFAGSAVYMDLKSIKNGILQSSVNVIKNVLSGDGINGGSITDLNLCNVGDILSTSVLLGDATIVGYNNSDVINSWAIERISGPASIAVSEKVMARYTSTTGQSMAAAATTLVNFDTLDFDTHGTVTVGTAWKFTAPIQSKYKVDANIYMANCTGVSSGAQYLQIAKNGTLHQEIGRVSESGATLQYSVHGSAVINLNAGDYIDLKYGRTGGATALHNSGTYNWISIQSI